MTEPAFTTDQETRAIAMMGLVISVGTISLLKNRAMISGGDIDDIFDKALNGLEERFPVDDIPAQIARVMLEATAKVLAAS